MRGAAANLVVTDPSAPMYIGAQKESVGCAELSAQIWLFAFMSHFGSTVARGKQLVVRYDSEYAAKMSQAFWAPSTNLVITQLAAGTRQVLDQLMSVSFEHVKSHSGDAWNEYADHICDCGGTGVLCSFPDSDVFSVWAKFPIQAGWFLFDDC